MKTCLEYFLLLLTLSTIQFRCYGCSHRWPTGRTRSSPTVTPVTGPVNLGEGPHWDHETGALFFVDIHDGLVNRYDPTTNTVSHAYLGGHGVTLVIPVANSGARKILASRGHDVVVFDWDYENVTLAPPNDSNVVVLATVETSSNKAGNRWNDGKADAKGRLWAGTMGSEPVIAKVTPLQGSLYLLDQSNSFNAINKLSPVSISNGLAWNANNDKLYYIDSPTFTIASFDFDLDAGTIANRRVVFNLTEHGVEGSPDGMTIDSNENLWIACFNGSQVINVDPNSGELIGTVQIPASRVTSVMFGGPQLDTLYVTTARYGLTDEELQQQPLAGSVFAVTGLGASALAPANNVVVPQDKLH